MSLLGMAVGEWQPICNPCRKELRKERRGKHREHKCKGGGITGSIGWICDCKCNRPSSRYQPPMMALDY